MSDKDFKQDLEMWGQMWDEMQGEPEASVSHPQERMKLGDYLRQDLDTPTQSSQDIYYNYNQDQLLQEEETVQNPVYPDSKGPDHESPEAVWVTENLVKEVEDLKEKLFSVENRLAAQMGGNGKWVEKAHNPDHGKLMKEIDSLKKRIEKASSSLGIKDEPSPWKV